MHSYIAYRLLSHKTLITNNPIFFYSRKGYYSMR